MQTNKVRDQFGLSVAGGSGQATVGNLIFGHFFGVTVALDRGVLSLDVRSVQCGPSDLVKADVQEGAPLGQEVRPKQHT
jgi:hypothetical protein